MTSNAAPGYKTHPGHRITTTPSGVRVRVRFNGEVIADSRDAMVLEEGTYPPVYYLPRKDVKMERLERTAHRTHCPFKGDASYYSLVNGPANAVWSYEHPYDEMLAIKERLAFYPDKVDSIDATTFTTPSERELVMERVFDAPRGRVFEAWTRPEHPPHWMLGPEGWTMPVCEIDLRPGGGWHFVWRRPEGTAMEMRGTYREIAPPGRLVSTESWGGNWPETLNTLTLAEKDGRTAMALRILYPSKEARDAALGTGMKAGASESFDRLAEYLGTPA